MRLGPGDKLGRYVIEGLLGEGGMGSVYRAFDTKLERRVALKVVRHDEAPGPATRGRGGHHLLSEARAAAGIEHVNAIAIHDVGEFGDTTYIAMELVKGKTLRDSVGDTGVPIATRVRWLTDVARALEAAHARGLVHRDVKPENVMIREDGVVKVLDFGIASVGGVSGIAEGDRTGKSDRPPARAASAGETGSSWGRSLAGALVGTPRYMSPEQLAGRTVDARADQYAWGVMAYELLAGAPPWDGGGVVTLSLVADVQEKRPAPLQTVAPSVPTRIARVVERTLENDPEKRFASMAEVVLALGAEPDTRGSRRAYGVATAALALILAGSAWIARRPREAAIPPSPTDAASSRAPAFALRPTHVRRITFEDGCEEFPAFFPDSRHVVFDVTRGHDTVLVVQSLTDGDARTLTQVRGWDSAPDVSPDGKDVAFNRYVDGEAGAWIVDVDGARPPRFLARGAVLPTYSPDGAGVWCGDGERLVRVDVRTGKETRELRSAPGAVSPRIRELSDGRVVVLFPGVRGAVTGVAVYAVDGSTRWVTPDPLLNDVPSAGRLFWRDALHEVLAITPSESYAIVSRDTEVGNAELYALPLEGGEPVHVAASDVTAYSGLRFSPDGGLMAWSTCRAEQAPVRAAAEGKLVPLRDAQPWLETAVAKVPGSGRMVVLSQRDGAMAPWVMDLDAKAAPRKLVVPGRPVGVAVSPDGSLVALELSGAGIVLAPIEGGDSRPLTTLATDGKPSFLRDGKTLLFTRKAEGSLPQIFSIDTAGGEPTGLLPPGTTDPAPSPTDGRIAYLSGSDRNKLTPFLADLGHDEKRRLSAGLAPGAYRAVAFSPDGRRVGLLLGASHVFEVDAASGKVLRSIDSGMDSFDGLSYLGDDPILIRARWVGDLWLADGPFK